MPFIPFQKKTAMKDDDPTAGGTAPTFSKQFAKKRKQRKAAPAQKALMSSGRALGGGGR